MDSTLGTIIISALGGSALTLGVNALTSWWKRPTPHLLLSSNDPARWRPNGAKGPTDYYVRYTIANAGDGPAQFLRYTLDSTPPYKFIGITPRLEPGSQDNFEVDVPAKDFDTAIIRIAHRPKPFKRSKDVVKDFPVHRPGVGWVEYKGLHVRRL